MERREFLDPKKNPLFEYAKVQTFLATRDGQVVGTIAAVRNDRYGQFHPEEAHVGFFGLYECVPDQAVADALFKAADAWLKAEGKTVARGPVNLTTNDVVGLLVDGFDLDNSIMMPYNPAYYGSQFEAAGFTKAKDFYEYYLAKEDSGARLTAAAKHVERGGKVKVRLLDMGKWRKELDFVRETYNVAWAQNWGFVPWTDRELEFVAKELKPLVDKRFAFVGEVDGVPAGFIVSVPDANEALKLAQGKLLPTGLLKILWKLKVKGCDNLRTMIMGVLPQYRNRGLDLLMIHHTAQAAHGTQYRGAQLGWILEDNQALLSPLEQLGCKRTKTYRVYDRDI
jgi:GNAT superfamily N-acetyltransferase